MAAVSPATWEENTERPDQISNQTRDCQSSRGFFVWKNTPGTRRAKRKAKMNANYRPVPTLFGPETRFEVRPAPPAPFRALGETELERLKTRLLRNTLDELAPTRATGYVRRAANEAAALAWVTPYPLLVFPVLFEEKVERTLLQAERQDDILQRSPELLVV